MTNKIVPLMQKLVSISCAMCLLIYTALEHSIVQSRVQTLICVPLFLLLGRCPCLLHEKCQKIVMGTHMVFKQLRLIL